MKTGEEWRIRNSNELEELIGGEDIVRLIKSMRINWLGHVMRMVEDRMRKEILTQTINVQRRKGIPRRRWLQNVDDLREMDIGDWRLED